MTKRSDDKAEVREDVKMSHQIATGKLHITSLKKEVRTKKKNMGSVGVIYSEIQICPFSIFSHLYYPIKCAFLLVLEIILLYARDIMSWLTGLGENSLFSFVLGSRHPSESSASSSSSNEEDQPSSVRIRCSVCLK
jgi:hypothetical protein